MVFSSPNDIPLEGNNMGEGHTMITLLQSLDTGDGEGSLGERTKGSGSHGSHSDSKRHDEFDVMITTQGSACFVFAIK